MQFNAWGGFVLQVFIIVFITLLLNFAARIVLDKVLLKLNFPPLSWDRLARQFPNCTMAA